MGYLAVTAGVGCAASAANAAVVFYGNDSNTNIQADPVGVNIGLIQNIARAVDSSNFRQGSYFRLVSIEYFTQGSDHSGSEGVGNAGLYNLGLTLNLMYGAVAGDQNYANVSFDGNDSVYEAVAQFFFDNTGGGYLMAIATKNDIPNPQDLSGVGGTTLSISAGKAMIDAAAVPEPSSLVLLALGATGLAARRQRRKAG